MKKTTLFLLFALIFTCVHAQQVHNTRNPHDPATVRLPEEQRGEVLKFQLTDSKIYPGTRREVLVYVPQQYDGSKPACLLVCMDGILYDATTVMDNLIATGEMPVTIGVFINPGVVYDEADKVVRYNRCKEFDSTDEQLALFIESEVLPHVEELRSKKGLPILVSKDANDRAITGASSGGIAAFSVAWHRPDMFSRVYTTVGTFVAMRGGNTYPSIVRKTEPKPLRIYMQDGWHDVWNPIFGEWFEYNLLMESALNFAGYEAFHKWDRGNHSIRYGMIAFPDAMRWLWKGYPAKVQKGKSLNGMLKDILLPEEDWKEVKLNTQPNIALFAAPDSAALFTANHKVYKVAHDGTVTEYATLKADEQLMGWNLTARGTSLYKDGKKVAGGLHELQAALSLANGKFVALCGKDAKKTSQVLTLSEGCRALAISPDNRFLVTGEKNSHHLISTILDQQGNMLYSEPFYYLHDLSNGTKQLSGNMAFDAKGNLYVATTMGVQVCDHNGRVRAILSLPAGRVDALAFSGNYLFVQCGARLFVRRLHATSYNSWETPVSYKSQGQG